MRALLPPLMAGVPDVPLPPGSLVLHTRIAERLPAPDAAAEAIGPAVQGGGSGSLMQIGAGGQAALGTLAVQNTALFRLLRRRDSASNLLTGGDGDEENSLMMMGALGSIQLARFAQEVVHQSDRLVTLVLADVRLATGQTGGGETPHLCHLLERCTVFNQLRGLCCSALLASHAANAFNEGQFAYGRALANLSVAAHDQAGVEGRDLGETERLSTTLPGPPFTACLRAQTTGRPLPPHRHLLCASWVTAVVDFLRELAALEDRRQVKAQTPAPGGPTPKTLARKAASKAAARQHREMAARARQLGAGLDAAPVPK